jgi:hypothetical protein
MQKEEKGSSVFTVIFGEFIFIVLPFVVSGLAFIHNGQLSRLLSTSEWSLAASVLIGQAWMRLVSGASSAEKQDGEVHWKMIHVTMAVTFVLALVPSVMVLTFVLTDKEISIGWSIFQIILFVIGVILFFLLGWVGHTLTNRAYIRAVESKQALN